MSTPPPTPAGIDPVRLRAVTEQVTAMAARAREAGEQLGAIAVEATARDRSVTVTVGSGGILKSARPGPAASSVSAATLCASLMEAYGRAAREAAGRASDLMEQVTGKDTQVMRMMRAAMPAEEEDER